MVSPEKQRLALILGCPTNGFDRLDFEWLDDGFKYLGIYIVIRELAFGHGFFRGLSCLIDHQWVLIGSSIMIIIIHSSCAQSRGQMWSAVSIPNRKCRSSASTSYKELLDKEVTTSVSIVKMVGRLKEIILQPTPF